MFSTVDFSLLLPGAASESHWDPPPFTVSLPQLFPSLSIAHLWRNRGREGHVSVTHSRLLCVQSAVGSPTPTPNPKSKQTSCFCPAATFHDVAQSFYKGRLHTTSLFIFRLRNSSQFSLFFCLNHNDRVTQSLQATCLDRICLWWHCYALKRIWKRSILSILLVAGWSAPGCLGILISCECYRGVKGEKGLWGARAAREDMDMGVWGRDYKRTTLTMTSNPGVSTECR